MTSADVIQSLWMFVSKASDIDYFMYEAPYRDILKTWLGPSRLSSKWWKTENINSLRRRLKWKDWREKEQWCSEMKKIDTHYKCQTWIIYVQV